MRVSLNAEADRLASKLPTVALAPSEFLARQTTADPPPTQSIRGSQPKSQPTSFHPNRRFCIVLF
jgi:hypothetical protein